jgi:hypothetical protein
VFATGAPSVALFDSQFRQSRVLRSNIGWGGPILSNRFALGLSLQYQRGLNQSGSIDINFDSTAQFTLDDEGGRPVYATPGAIVPTTGVIAIRDTRASSAFNRVNVQRSDLQQETRLFSVNLKPVINPSLYYWDVTYTFQDVREQFRGFGSTVGNPFERRWDHALNPRHSVQLGLSYNAFDLIRLRTNIGLSWGSRYTPLVQGDINGDGSGFNDRAFIHDPAIAADPAVAAGMEALLAGSNGAARECLRTQLSRLAARGSCAGPMRANANLNVSFNPQKIGLPQRLRIGFTLNNPLVLADMLLHGDARMRGWGQNIAPDQSLLVVRGFDPATQRFRYEVNQRFGSTRPLQTVSRALTHLTITVNYDIGASRERQTLTQRLDFGRVREGSRQSAQNLKQLATATIPNPMALILQQPDSLALTRRQADSLAGMSRAFALHADSIWTPTARYLESLPADYDHDEAYDRYVVARERTVDFLIAVVPIVKDLLTPAQMRMLPPQIRNWLDVRVLRAIRSSTAG